MSMRRCHLQVYCIVLHCIAMFSIVLYCSTLYCIVLHCFLLYCSVVHCIVLLRLSLQRKGLVRMYGGPDIN